ncbi:MAG: folylpolyglutamate synthase/dihydrofolate synthase family protein [Armatimonadota bacterium]
MTYSEATAYLESLIDYEKTPAGSAAARLWNLDRMIHMLREVGDPHLGLRVVHIAGTKGKGSTSAMAASILTAAGHRTGLYTSPHLVSFRERVRVNGRCIAEADVVRLVEQVRPIVESMREREIGLPSFFDAYTLIALLHFAQQDVAVAVLETGLGGRLDATNVVHPIACGITRIGIDHTMELGDTLSQIAWEKAGIIKPGVAVVSAPQLPEVTAVLEEACLERGAQLLMVGAHGPKVTNVRSEGTDRQLFTIEGMDGLYRGLACPLLGAYQAENAAVAIGLAEVSARQGIEVTEAAIRMGIESVRWPGRFQIVGRHPYVILDGAHDELSARALADTVRTLFSGRRVLLVLGVHRDKDAKAISRELCPIADRVIATTSSSPRALPADELQRVAFPRARHTSAFTPVSLAIREALGAATPDDVILVTGSLYVVGEAMTALGVEPSDCEQ